MTPEAALALLTGPFGVVAAGIIFILALFGQKLVLGWTYRERVAEVAEWKKLYYELFDRIADTLEVARPKR